VIFATLFHFLGGVAADPALVPDIFNDHGARRNQRIGAYCNPLDNARPGTDMSAVSDRNVAG
jgi:hypothetical protein